MAARVAVILSGCGNRDGSELRETLFTLLSLERAHCEVVFAAPDVEQPYVIDHLSGETLRPQPARRVLAESARIARGVITPLGQLDPATIDAAIFPGGRGVGSVLSNYEDKAQVCDVDPDVARLLRALLAAHKPMGFICLAPILAARVLGPVAGVRVTLGPRGTSAAKHAAVMGADVRPSSVGEVVIDRDARVVSTPAYMCEEPRLTEVAGAIDKLVRIVLSLCHQQDVPAPPPVRAPDNRERKQGDARGPGPAGPPGNRLPPARTDRPDQSTLDPRRASDPLRRRRAR